MNEMEIKISSSTINFRQENDIILYNELSAINKHVINSLEYSSSFFVYLFSKSSARNHNITPPIYILYSALSDLSLLQPTIFS